MSVCLLLCYDQNFYMQSINEVLKLYMINGFKGVSHQIFVPFTQVFVWTSGKCCPSFLIGSSLLPKVSPKNPFVVWYLVAQFHWDSHTYINIISGGSRRSEGVSTPFVLDKLSFSCAKLTQKFPSTLYFKVSASAHVYCPNQGVCTLRTSHDDKDWFMLLCISNILRSY